MTENETKIIKYTITRLLAGREHSQHELLKKLVQRDLPSDLCLHWIKKFSQQNLQSDERFADSLIRGRVNKGIGEVKIRHELNEHKISAEIVSTAFKELDIDWLELALTVFQKKFRGKGASDWKTLQKQQRFLYSRGFSLEQIRYACQTHKL